MKNLITKLGLSAAFFVMAACAHHTEVPDSRTVASIEADVHATVHPRVAIYAALSCVESGKKLGKGVRANILLRPTSGKISVGGQDISLKRNGDKKEVRKADGHVNPIKDKRFTSENTVIVAPFDIFRADGPVQIHTELNSQKIDMNCIAMERYLERAKRKR